MAEPIWKDYYVTLGTNDSYEYRIEIDGKVVYEGKAHKRPNADYVSVRLNDIVANYLSIDYDGQKFVGGEVKCAIYLLGGLSNQLLAEVSFYANWSYEEGYSPSKVGLSDPINSRVMQLIPIPYSCLNASELEIETIDKNHVFYRYPHNDGKINHYFFDVEDAVAAYARDTYIDDYRVYHVVDSCARYALYYLNAYGGIDLFLIEGNHSERDNLTRHTRKVEYDNRVVSNRGKSDYAVEITKSLTLHTSWLSDDEASRMHHLLNSPLVYLFDIVKKQMIPVVLTNTTTDYQTFKGNGGKLVQYAIEVEYANERERR
jgi:hypothetical protein